VKLDLPRRLALFGTAILVVSAALGWRAWVAWRETGRLAELGPALEAGQQLAEHYKAEVLEMNHALARYGITGIPTVILVGRDGKVVSMDVRGEKLGEELAKIFKDAK
jgi:hypothetical protein